jgi:hypothetical protein
MTDTLDAAPATAAPTDGGIRAFTAADAPAVARLLLRAFQGRDTAPPPDMVAYLRRVYLDAPWYDPEIAARVALDGRGAVVGFAGLTAQRYRLDGRPIRAAFSSSLAADDRAGDPTIAVRLLRHIYAGPQDAVLSDRANAASTGLARALRAEVVRDYSLDWLRVLRPAGLAVATAAARFRPARLAGPLLAPLDAALLRRAAGDDQPRWSVPTQTRQAANFSDREAGMDELLELIPHFVEAYPLRPDWSRDELAFLLADAAQKRTLGTFVARTVLAPGGRPAGLFLYHLRRGRIAHVLQILAAPGREGVVIDRAVADALARGAVALRGRAQPALLPALMERRAVLLPELAAVLHTRDTAVRQHFAAGSAFFTGLAGENWMRLNGDSFA